MKNSSKAIKNRNEKRRRWKEEKDFSKIDKYKEKKCKDCGMIKLCKFTSSFTSGSGEPEYRSVCEDCYKLRCKKYRKKNRETLTEQISARRRGRKVYGVKMLGGKCSQCHSEYNGKNAAMFVFHHINPKEKEFGIAANLMNYSWEKIINEMKKCDLLCSNCHELNHSIEY